MHHEDFDLKLIVAQMALDEVPVSVIRFFRNHYTFLQTGTTSRELAHEATMTIEGVRWLMRQLETRGYVVSVTCYPKGKKGGPYIGWTLADQLLKDEELALISRLMRIQYGMENRSKSRRAALSPQT